MRLGDRTGFSLVELMVMLMVMGIILTAGSMVFVSGQNLFAVTSAQSDLQAATAQVLQRMSFELQDSGYDSAGQPKFTVVDNAGVNNTDILRFSIPLCVCGTSPIDANGEVSRWGAPLVWGQNGCDDDYPVGQNGKVEICHFPPGNQQNGNTLNVNENSVKAHLAHGDYIGDCDGCSPSMYTNRSIEYALDANGRMVRRVLDSSGQAINTFSFAEKLVDFQVTTSGSLDYVRVTVKGRSTGAQGRTFEVINGVDVLLRNR